MCVPEGSEDARFQALVEIHETFERLAIGAPATSPAAHSSWQNVSRYQRKEDAEVFENASMVQFPMPWLGLTTSFRAGSRSGSSMTT